MRLYINGLTPLPPNFQLRIALDELKAFKNEDVNKSLHAKDLREPREILGHVVSTSSHSSVFLCRVRQDAIFRGPEDWFNWSRKRRVPSMSTTIAFLNLSTPFPSQDSLYHEGKFCVEGVKGIPHGQAKLADMLAEGHELLHECLERVDFYTVGRRDTFHVLPT